MNLQSKVVFITGASKGIGRETALAFAGEGCNLALTFKKHREDAERTAEECRALGAPEVIVLPLDVLDDTSLKQAVKKVVGTFKSIDILVNNAAVIAWKKLRDQDFGDIESQIRVNLEGLIKMTKECLPHIKEMLVNIASGAGYTGYAELSTYCSTKFGVRGFTQALANEEKFTVVNVNPDMTATGMTDFKGRPPKDVAEVIVKTAKGDIRVESGGDVDVWEHAKDTTRY